MLNSLTEPHRARKETGAVHLVCERRHRSCQCLYALAFRKSALGAPLALPSNVSPYAACSRPDVGGPRNVRYSMTMRPLKIGSFSFV